MLRKELTFDRFAAIMCLDRDHSFETTPQPVRGTPALTLVLPFTEYVMFLNDLPDTFDMLYKKPEVARANAVQCYYSDVARAVVKELYFCSLYNMKPTHIRHRFDDIPPTAPAVDWRDNDDMFRRYTESLGFSFSLTPAVKEEWVYACTLVGYSRNLSLPKWNIL